MLGIKARASCMLGSQPLYQWSHIPIPSEPLSYLVMLSRSQALSQHTLVTLFQALLLAGRQHSLYHKRSLAVPAQIHMGSSFLRTWQSNCFLFIGSETLLMFCSVGLDKHPKHSCSVSAIKDSGYHPQASPAAILSSLVPMPLRTELSEA